MAVSADDLRWVRAQWEEWAAGSGVVLGLEVCPESCSGEMLSAAGTLGARVASASSVRVTIRSEADGVLLFEHRVAHDAAALRAAVSVLARAVARGASRGRG